MPDDVIPTCRPSDSIEGVAAAQLGRGVSDLTSAAMWLYSRAQVLRVMYLSFTQESVNVRLLLSWVMPITIVGNFETGEVFLRSH